MGECLLFNTSTQLKLINASTLIELSSIDNAAIADSVMTIGADVYVIKSSVIYKYDYANNLLVSTGIAGTVMTANSSNIFVGNNYDQRIRKYNLSWGLVATSEVSGYYWGQEFHCNETYIFASNVSRMSYRSNLVYKTSDLTIDTAFANLGTSAACDTFGHDANAYYCRAATNIYRISLSTKNITHSISSASEIGKSVIGGTIYTVNAGSPPYLNRRNSNDLTTITTTSPTAVTAIAIGSAYVFSHQGTFATKTIYRSPNSSTHDWTYVYNIPSYNGSAFHILNLEDPPVNSKISMII